MTASATSGFEVSLCGPADRPEQARLFGACFKKPIEPAGLSWRYDESPHGSAVSAVTRPTDPPGEGVSGYACSPRLAWVAGDEATLAPVGETGDVMTHPEWRKRGLFSDLDRRVMEETGRLGWPCVFGLPNRRSAHIFLKLGWEQIGTVRPWTCVLRADHGARRERFGDGRIASWLVPADRLRADRARRRLAAAGAGWKIEPLGRFPAEVGELAQRIAGDFGFMVRRDAAYLDWRFGRAPSGLFRALLARGPDGRLGGYVVVQRPRAGESVGYLVDLLAPDEGARAALLAAGLEALREAGTSVARATAIDGSWWAEVLARAGFRPPKPENHLIVILYVHQPDHPLVRAARDTRRWYFTDGDRDDETMG